MRVAYIGNFSPAHSTENHVKAAWERLGHEVLGLQENDSATWDLAAPILADGLTMLGKPADLILWTRTGWDWQHDCGWTTQEAWDRQSAMLDAALEAGIPTVAFHLDRWWGLDREGQVYDEPFFRCQHVITADGSHPQAWLDAGVNHHWMPPAVSLAQTELEGRNLPRAYPHQVAFVGSWQIRPKHGGGTDGYHDEWGPHRLDMLNACRKHFGRRFGCYPQQRRALRGQPLADLYQTVPVLVGDSCLAPFSNPPRNYWSDRVPETLGRGGLLVHPDVDGTLRARFNTDSLRTHDLGDYGEMLNQIERLLSLTDSERVNLKQAARLYTQRHHTYEIRVESIIELLTQEEALHAKTGER